MSASAAPMSQSDPRSSQLAVPKPRIAVVTPFLDKAYGTERTVIEWLSHMPDAFEIHVYSQRVEDLDAQRIMWHRIPALPGPGLLSFTWWFAANHLRRAWDRYARGLRYDFVYSPGINCFDADVIFVRIVFAEFLRQAGDELAWSRVPLRDWPRLLHRKLYYRLIVALERRIYSDPKTRWCIAPRRPRAISSGFTAVATACRFSTLGSTTRRSTRLAAPCFAKEHVVSWGLLWISSPVSL